MNLYTHLKASLFLLAAPLFSLEEKPWFGNCYEFEGRATYAYSYFDKVDHGHPSLKKTWHDHLLTLSLEATIPENWSWEVEVQSDATTRRSFNYSSTAAQGRYLWLDDVAGDAVSLATGITMRQTNGLSLHQLSTPYHARFCTEFHASIGRELSNGPNWTSRFFAFGAFGLGNRGASWWRTDLFYLGNYCDNVQWRLFLLGYFGNGHKKCVNLNHFHNWGEIAHRSIDLGGGIRFLFCTRGSLNFDYVRRLYARSYPESVNFFVFSYEIPFCPF